VRVLNFGHFFDPQEGGSTYMRIDLYVRTYGMFPKHATFGFMLKTAYAPVLAVADHDSVVDIAELLT